jgi:hypothetical protein
MFLIKVFSMQIKAKGMTQLFLEGKGFFLHLLLSLKGFSNLKKISCFIVRNIISKFLNLLGFLGHGRLLMSEDFTTFCAY